ncbi:MAG TPA: ATP synthase F1 subunit delta [Candidatus Eremiobacteraceae bacterium]
MASETLARRYSAALFAVAQDADAVETVVREVDAIVAMLASDPSLLEFFASPVVDRALKTQILHDSIHGRVGEIVENFIILLVRKRRENLLPTIARQLHEMRDESAGRSVAEIATPTPLTPAELADLARRLSHVYKRTIVPQAKVSPELLGGIIVQVGDRYVDGSVLGKLDEVRRHLLASIDAPDIASPNGKTN